MTDISQNKKIMPLRRAALRLVTLTLSDTAAFSLALGAYGAFILAVTDRSHLFSGIFGICYIRPFRSVFPHSRSSFANG